MSLERRRLTRLNGFRIGTCRPLDDASTAALPTECLIWNHNEHGALLEFTEAASPDAAFRLLCPELAIDAPCRIIWRDGREWGVAYTG